MWSLYQDLIVESGKQPMFILLCAFVITFVATRLITRMIRAGRGPFKNVSAGGVHVHHVVPGVIAVLLGGLIGFGASPNGPWVVVGSIMFGVGAALVLDEFAMILHFDDVYWKEEGRLSADVALIAVAVLAVALLTASPADPPGPPETDPYVGVLLPILFILVVMVPIAITLLKGRMFLGAVSLLFPLLAWFTAFRLARPGSPWAFMRYRNSPEKRQRAIERFDRVDERWAPIRLWVQEHIFGFSRSTQGPARRK